MNSNQKIKVLYHTHEYLPKIEAVSQEIDFLKQYFSGAVYEIRKYQKVRWIPGRILRRLYARKPAKMEEQFNLHHLYYPGLKEEQILYLDFLKKPVIFTVMAPNLGFPDPLQQLTQIKAIAAKVDWIVVSTEKDRQFLVQQGINQISVILPGVNLDQFHYQDFPQDPQQELTLVMASAPWTKEQFESKGINLLIEAARKMDVSFNFLWRGVFDREIENLVRNIQLKDRIKIFHQIVDVNQILGKSHGAIAIFLDPNIAKAYPNSLLDSLACGKPVIVSDNVPLAEIIQKEGVGVVVKPNLSSLMKGIQEFQNNYARYQRNCRKVAQKYFDQRRLLQDYRSLYQRVLQNAK